MSKQILNQRYTYKITSNYLQRNKWNITINNIPNAIKNRQIVGIGDSTGTRMIREIIRSKYTEDYINNLKLKLENKKRLLRRADSNKKAIKKEIQKLIDEKNQASLIPEICNVIFSSKKHYEKAEKKGFFLNGKKYVLLLGTAGGIKQNTVMFCREDIYEPLMKKIMNNVDLGSPVLPSKLMSYMSLVFSSSTPVTNTQKILVVKDVITHFKSPVTLIQFNDEANCPDVKDIQDYEVEVNACDGCGLIHPSLADTWSEDLQLDYNFTSVCCRNSWVKGMLTRFDFRTYCKEVLNTNIVKDIWGQEHCIDDIDIILNESMLKLHKGYKSIKEYNDACEENGYTFSVTKATPNILENERALNYQYIQCLDLNDKDIEELVSHDIKEIKDVLGLDYKKSILFSKGKELNDKNVWNESIEDDYYTKALMVEPKVIGDDYIIHKIRKAISKRIDLLKTGKIKVGGNYQIAIGDPIIQLESMCGFEPKGLLKSGEFYNSYWMNKGVNKVGAFRSPMSCKSNARVMNICNREEVVKWYKDIKNVIIFNAWDTAMMAFNGEDYDGDINFTTSNEIIINGIFDLPAICCIGKSGVKISYPKREDFVNSIEKGFGNKVGGVTNYGSSCYSVISKFPKGSKEYEEIDYRIKCIQYYQQECIDSAKNGEPPKPIPSYWSDRHAEELKYDIDESTGEIVNTDEEIDKIELYNNIVAEKKPYYFIYIYDSLKKEYNDFIKETTANCIRKFLCTPDELRAKPYKTQEESDFLLWYDKKNPIDTNPCIVNKIAWNIERNFDNFTKLKLQEFDSNIYKTECSRKATKTEINKILDLCKEYQTDSKAKSVSHQSDKENAQGDAIERKDLLRVNIANIIPEEDVLLNTIIELSYEKKKLSKNIAWVVGGKLIVNNLLKNNQQRISYPIKDTFGDIKFGGETFSMVDKIIDKKGIFNEDK